MISYICDHCKRASAPEPENPLKIEYAALEFSNVYPVRMGFDLCEQCRGLMNEKVRDLIRFITDGTHV